MRFISFFNFCLTYFIYLLQMNQKFFSLLMKTQMFIRFIEERSFVCDGDQGLAFFDECTERVSGLDDVTTNVRLLDIDMAAHSSERTVFVLPPDNPHPGKIAFQYCIGNTVNSLFRRSFPRDRKNKTSYVG